MLKLLELPQQLTLPDDTPFGCKIKSAAAAYGLGEPFAQFWVQDGGAVLAKIDSQAVLTEGAQTDWDELTAFVRTLDLTALSCMESTAGKLNLPMTTSSSVPPSWQASR